MNDLSVMMNFAMIAVPVPGIANLIQSIILNILQLDILQTGVWLVPYLTSKNIDDEGEAPDDESLSVYFETAGLGSLRMLLNLGSTLVYLVIYFSAIFAYALLHYAGFLWPR